MRVTSFRMIRFQCDFRSSTLNRGVSATVLLPNEEHFPRSAGDRVPVVYLLHGRTDDHTAWTRKTALERHGDGHPFAIVMPGADLSFYTNMRHGGAYFSFIAEELPQRMESWFPISGVARHRCIAGLSMGGYGALKVALSQPARWRAAASLSGVLDMAQFLNSETDPMHRQELDHVFGSEPEISHSEHDLFALLERASLQGDPVPHLHLCCGTEDFLYDHSVRFRDFARRLESPLVYEEGPGAHDWAYWDAVIPSVLRRFHQLAT